MLTWAPGKERSGERPRGSEGVNKRRDEGERETKETAIEEKEILSGSAKEKRV